MPLSTAKLNEIFGDLIDEKATFIKKGPFSFKTLESGKNLLGIQVEFDGQVVDDTFESGELDKFVGKSLAAYQELAPELDFDVEEVQITINYGRRPGQQGFIKILPTDIMS